MDFESIVQAAYEAILAPGDIAIDVGAHLGRHTIPMAKRVFPSGRVFAVEPLPTCRKALEDEIAERHRELSGVITVCPYALSDYDGKANFVVAVDALAYSGLKRREYDSPTRLDKIRVKVRRADSLFFQLPRLKYIKIDAEGGEFHIVKGALGCIEKFRPVVCFEFGAKSIGEYRITPAHMAEFWVANGYKVYDIRGKWLPPTEFVESATVQNVWDYVAVPVEDPRLQATVAETLKGAYDALSTAPRPKVTVAVPFPIYPPVGGGQWRVFSLYRNVARDFDVDLVSIAEAGSHFFEGEIAPGMKEIRIPKSLRHQDEEGRIARDAGGVPLGDIAMTLFLEYTPEYFDHLAHSMEAAAVVVASHPYCLPAIRKFLGHQPLVYEAHNVEYLLKEEVLRRGGSVGAELVDVVRKVEAETCGASNLVLCCSRADGDELRRLYGVDSSRIVVAPNGVDTEAVQFTSPSAKERLKAKFGIAGQRIALFVASWHPPNLEAAEAIFEMARTIPYVKFLLVGSQCLPLANRPRPRNVGLMGVVDHETLAVLLAVADVALNPMLGGSGTNLKMATYLAAGLPVITTALGARGYDLIDGEHALMCPVQDFPGKIAEVLNDKALAERLATRGRRLVEERYDWKAVASGVISAFRSLLQLPEKSRDVHDDLVGRVSAEMAELGVPESHPLVRQVAMAVDEMGLYGRGPGGQG